MLVVSLKKLILDLIAKLQLLERVDEHGDKKNHACEWILQEAQSRFCREGYAFFRRKIHRIDLFILHSRLFHLYDSIWWEMRFWIRFDAIVDNKQ